MNSFKEWKDTYQKEFDRLVDLRRRAELSVTGKERLSMYRAFLNIADWSDSATEVVEWIDGKHEMDPEIRAAIDSPLAMELITEIRVLAKEEQQGKESLTKAGIYIPNMEMPKDVTLLAISPDGTVDIVHGEGDLTWKTLKDKAISVPSHGRLGDLDALIAMLERQINNHEKQAKMADAKGTGYTNDMYICDRNRDIISMLKTAPIIIPADPSNER